MGIVVTQSTEKRDSRATALPPFSDQLPAILFEMVVDAAGEQGRESPDMPVVTVIGGIPVRGATDTRRLDLADHVLPEDKGNLTRSLRRAVSQGEQWAWRGRMRDDAGVVRWMTLRAAPTSLRRGEGVVWQGVLVEADPPASSARLEDLVAQTDEWVWETDEWGRLTYVSSRFRDATGIETERLIGRHMFHWRTVDEGGAGPRLSDLVDGRRPLRDVTYTMRIDGRSLTVRTSGRPIVDGQGDFVGYRGVARDVSDEIALRGRERELMERLENIMAAAQVGIAMLDADFKIELCSKRFLSMLGYEGADSETSMPVVDFRALSPAPFVERQIRYLDEMRAGRRDHFQIEKPLRRPDGSEIWVLLDCVCVRDEAGAVERFVSSLIDVGERRRSDETAARTRRLLDEALEALSAGLALFDPDDRLVFCNQRFKEYHGGPEECYAPGIGFEDMLRQAIEHGSVDIGEADREEWLAARIERHRNPPEGGEDRLSRGRWYHIRERVMPGGWVVGLYIDATEIKEKEQQLEANLLELRDTQDRLEEQTAKLVDLAEGLSVARDQALTAARSKAEFLANMSHELRTPLNAILGFSEMLQSDVFGSLNPKQSEYVADIRQSGQHLLSLINDILDLSKAEAGKLALAEGQVPVLSVLERSRRMVVERARRGGVDVAIDADRGMERANILGDERKLTQILLNLLSNAVKFTPGGGRITVAAHWIDEGEWSGGLRLQVVDTGIGIAAKDIERVFAPFEQVDSSLSRKYEGTGLGMSLVKVMVELHDGEIDLESEPDVGTTVTITLPPHRILLVEGEPLAGVDAVTQNDGDVDAEKEVPQ